MDTNNTNLINFKCSQCKRILPIAEHSHSMGNSTFCEKCKDLNLEKAKANRNQNKKDVPNTIELANAIKIIQSVGIDISNIKLPKTNMSKYRRTNKNMKYVQIEKRNPKNYAIRFHKATSGSKVVIACVNSEQAAINKALKIDKTIGEIVNLSK